MIWGGGVCPYRGACHGKLPVWNIWPILQCYCHPQSPHISFKTESLCIPTYFSVYLKPREVIIMHKIHKYLKTFLSSRRRHPWHHTIMAGTRDGPRQPVPPSAPFPVGLSPLLAHPPPSAWPPVTAPHPQNNLISINYYNLWLISFECSWRINMNWKKNN